MGKDDQQTVHTNRNAQLYSAVKLQLVLFSVGIGKQTNILLKGVDLVRFVLLGSFSTSI